MEYDCRNIENSYDDRVEAPKGRLMKATMFTP
jgi:hypothetical protein